MAKYYDSGTRKSGTYYTVLSDGFVKRQEKRYGKNLLEKCFPYIKDIIRNKNNIKYSNSIKEKIGVDVVTVNYKEKKVTEYNGEGTLLTIKIEQDFLESKRFHDYTTLSFIEFKGKIYWIPFGW